MDFKGKADISKGSWRLQMSIHRLTTAVSLNKS